MGNWFQDLHGYQDAQVLYVKWHGTVGALYSQVLHLQIQPTVDVDPADMEDDCIPTVMPHFSHGENGDNNSTYVRGCG